MIPQRLPLHCGPGQALLMEVLINYYYPHLKEESQLDSWWDWLGSPSLVNETQLPTASLSQNFSQDCILRLKCSLLGAA